MPYNKDLWNEIMEIGREKEPRSVSVTNSLDEYDVTTIVATQDFFGATDIWKQQTIFDLYGPPRYRVFDWLAMSVMGRNDDDRQQNEPALKVLVHSYLKAEGVPEAFIDDLRVSDYQVDTSWEDVVIDLPDEKSPMDAYGSLDGDANALQVD